jgi:23S rRNA pseudouridine1911/1915/1917 synthase
MEIIFCDNHLLIVSKPSGISTQPHHEGADDNLLDLAKAWLKRQFQKPGKVFLEPIHRLDTPVSGLVLFARTSKALSRLQEMMRERKIEKTYFTWIEGSLPEREGTLEHFLLHDEHCARVVDASHPRVKLAILHYLHIDQQKGKSLVEIHLETGRYHQIRAQFAAIDCPVIGDIKYGSPSLWKKNRIALHHGRLKFSHPVTKVNLTFESIPEEMRHFM